MSKTDKRHLAPILLLLSDDEPLANLVLQTAKPPWQTIRQDPGEFLSQGAFRHPNVRLVILDDQTLEEDDRNWLIPQIGKHFSGALFLYVAGAQSDGNEKRARTGGAHYYISKPYLPERFGQVVQSFLREQQVKL